MTTYFKTSPSHHIRRQPTFGLWKLLFALFLMVIFFLLGQTMERHNFHQGQRIHRDGSIGQ